MIDSQKLIDNHKNVILVGGSGSAKTHLAIGLAFTGPSSGLSVRKISSVLEYTNHIALNTYINKRNLKKKLQTT